MLCYFKTCNCINLDRYKIRNNKNDLTNLSIRADMNQKQINEKTADSLNILCPCNKTETKHRTVTTSCNIWLTSLQILGANIPVVCCIYQYRTLADFFAVVFLLSHPLLRSELTSFYSTIV